MATLIVGESPCRIPSIVEMMKNMPNFHVFCLNWEDFAKRLGVIGQTIEELKKDLNSEVINMEGLLCEILYTWKRKSGDEANLNVLCRVVTDVCHANSIAEKLKTKFTEIASNADSVVPEKSISQSSSFSCPDLLHKFVEDTIRLDSSELKEKINLVLNVIKRNPALINSLNNEELTPLLIDSIHVELINVLICAGANVDAVDGKGCNFVHLAAEYLPPEQFERLVQYLKNHELIHLMNAVNCDQQTPLLKLMWNNSKLKPSTIEAVAAAGVNMNAFDKNGATVLSDAIWTLQDVGILQSLVESGADFTWKSLINSTILHKAAWKGHIEALQYFVRLGLDVNSRDNNGNTPLSNAIRSNKFGCNLMMIKFLLENGANVNAKDNYGNSPLSLAVEHNRDLAILQTLVAYGADINWSDEYNSSLLNVAAFEGNLPVVKYLIELGLDVNSQDNYRFTPLMQVIVNGNVKKENKIQIVKFLLDKNANIDATTSTGYSSIYFARKFKLIEIHNLLVLKQRQSATIRN